MTQRTYYPPAATPAAPAASVEEITSSDPTHLRHGYTLAALDGIARQAVLADRLMAMSAAERYDIAWSAIAYALCTATEPPHRSALVQIGWQAIARHVRDGQRSRGYRADPRELDGAPTMARFVKYWHTYRTVPSPEDGIVERVAVWQTMEGLGEIYRDAILALAIHDDYHAAAAAIGLQPSALTVRLTIARRYIQRRWYEGETPRRKRSTDRRVGVHDATPAATCAYGHPWSPENTRHYQYPTTNGRVKTQRFCRTCERDRKAGVLRARPAKASPGEASA